MTPHYVDDSVTLYAGDCLDVLRELPDDSVDSVVTDPPYGLGFMGREWDDLPPGIDFAKECLRVLKPGGHLLAFGGSRTWHRLTCAIEDAGFEIRDSIAWLYGSGFPKSLDVSKAIDKAAGAEREVVGRGNGGLHHKATVTNLSKWDTDHDADGHSITAPATPDAQKWSGWGTALKPAFEPIVVARKPITGTVAANVLTHGTGALNIDGCRVEGEPWKAHRATGLGSVKFFTEGDNPEIDKEPHAAGRWPANVVLDDSQAAELDQQSGTSREGNGRIGGGDAQNQDGAVKFLDGIATSRYPGEGGASRFFPTFKYEPKAPTTERPRIKGDSDALFASSIRKRCTKCGKQEVNVRNSACNCDEPDFRPDQSMTNTIAHPTVKPLDLMRWLTRLVTPPGGTVLDPFSGSGTTAEACVIEGFQCIAIEREQSYLPLIVQRLTKPIQVTLI